MKKVNIMLVCFLALNFFSCSSDDDSSGGNKDAEINAQEDEPLEINSVTSGFIIEGATKKTGTLTPTGGLEFTMDYSKQSAFQKKGFEIEFNSASDYTGAYIQLKDENGMADSYFDVPRDEISISGKEEQTKKNRNFLKGKSAGKENDATIEVNLASTVTAGTFCYVICLYDGEGNISEPTEVCVTVEAWGGNSDLVGSWDYTKQIENGKEFKVKEEDCDSDTSTICNEEYSVDECHKINFINIKFNNDGTFEMNNSQTEKYLNNQESQANCGVVYQESSYTYNAKGKWAYNEEENRITIVNFSDVYDYGDEIDAETYEFGDLGLDGSLDISDSNLKITESDSYDGVEIDVYEYFFEKE